MFFLCIQILIIFVFYRPWLKCSFNSELRLFFAVRFPYFSIWCLKMFIVYMFDVHVLFNWHTQSIQTSIFSEMNKWNLKTSDVDRQATTVQHSLYDRRCFFLLCAYILWRTQVHFYWHRFLFDIFNISLSLFVFIFLYFDVTNPFHNSNSYSNRVASNAFYQLTIRYNLWQV